MIIFLTSKASWPNYTVIIFKDYIIFNLMKLLLINQINNQYFTYFIMNIFVKNEISPKYSFFF